MPTPDLKSFRANPLARIRPSAVRIFEDLVFGTRSISASLSPSGHAGEPACPSFVRSANLVSFLVLSLSPVARSEFRFRSLSSVARSGSLRRPSLPLILLSSLEDLSSVAKNHATKSRSRNTKISVQNSSFLCLTFPSILHYFLSKFAKFALSLSQYVGPNMSPAGAFNVVEPPTRNTAGVSGLVGLVRNCPGPNPAIPNGAPELITARSP